MRNRSREHLQPWEPIWPRDDLTKSSYRRRLRHYASEARADLGHAFFIFDAATDQLAGGVSLGNVRRGVTQTATLGYWMGAPYAGRGVMTKAVATLLPIAFHSLDFIVSTPPFNPPTSHPFVCLKRTASSKKASRATI